MHERNALRYLPTRWREEWMPFVYDGSQCFFWGARAEVPESEFNPRVVRVERPTHHYNYLVAPSGDWLATTDGKTLHLQGFVDDQAIWDRDGEGFRHAVSGLGLQASYTEIEKPTELRLGDGCVSDDGNIASEPGVYIVEHGPEKLPSEYLQTLCEKGWVSLTCILSPSVVDRLQRVGCVGAYEGRKPEMKHPLAQDPAVVKVTVEPVSLYLMRGYMKTRDVCLGHAPGVLALPKDDGKREVQGWHTDFPYLWGTGDRIPVSSGDLVLGVQRNTCVSDFTAENGATLFKLGSHTTNAPPPDEWGITNHTFQKGYRAKHGLPYGGPESEVIEAPAGSMVLYDARTWHRAGANLTDQKRGAMIQAFIPGYIIPFMDTSGAYRAFLDSDVSGQVTDCEQRELGKLMVHKIKGPAGLFAITVDGELTEQLREQAGPAQGIRY